MSCLWAQKIKQEKRRSNIFHPFSTSSSITLFGVKSSELVSDSLHCCGCAESLMTPSTWLLVLLGEAIFCFFLRRWFLRFAVFSASSAFAASFLCSYCFSSSIYFQNSLNIPGPTYF
jgi:hypothetical protein